MASWSENQGLNGTAKFLYTHSDEERFHMLKLIKFINERGGKAVIPSVEKPPVEFENIVNAKDSPMFGIGNIAQNLTKNILHIFNES